MSPDKDDATVVFHRPRIDAAAAETIAAECFGRTGLIRELPSERDRNFLLTQASGERVVLKISHADEPAGLLDLQHRVLERIADGAPGLAVPRVVRTLSGREVETIRSADGTPHLVRALTWVDGLEWAEAKPHTPEMLESFGRAMGSLDRALTGLSHPAATRELKWDLARSGWIRDHLFRLEDPARRALVERHLDSFEQEVLPRLPTLRRGIIHNDANDWNVIVGPGHPFERRVAGVVDFGDLLESAIVAEPAIACAYAMQGKRDPLAAAADLVRGYHAAFPLEEEELAILFPLIRTRLLVSVVNSAEQRAAFPEEAYLTISEREAWETLELLEAVHPRLAHYVFREAAGLEPCPASVPLRAWLERHGSRASPLLEIMEPSVVLDLSAGSPLIENPPEVSELPAFTRKLFGVIEAAGARVGIGRYDEARLLYAAGGFQAAGNDRDIPRTVHMGLDLFAPAGTPVLAPFPGRVAAVRDNGMDLDYGPTLILAHEPPGCPRFHTLYGHLGSEVLETLRPGDEVERGQPIATIGDLGGNGGWPPHLHFQIIADLLDRDGEFPGVARCDQRAVWKSLSPDPNLLAGIPAPGISAPPMGELVARRRQHIGPSLSISYRRPLHIVRGWKQFLFDADGLRYLDGVNNVAHVGHSHPVVVRAIREQASVLNTNTRYLHEKLEAFAERLTATLPAPLSVCYFVNSGSEANELAIRLARAATGRRGMVVVDVGYHGNTSTLVDVSPYKHDGRGGQGPPNWVRKIPMPDVYRGPIREDDPEAGRKYGATVIEAIRELAAYGEEPAAFLVESVLSCGGQIVLPPGFLAEAFRRARHAGALCIADEVQVGLGRAGDWWWAFESQGVVPDIVTMGKPLGNGHPLGAVVTTPDIAAAFDNGMEYFNTFGGNPVSCAAGLAVLDVIDREGLRQHAATTGARLLEGLLSLVERHERAGDARGLGLFAGLELVRTKESREPDGALAAFVANRMRDKGILISTDGPFHNVLKMKPPLCFSPEDADTLVSALDAVLREAS